MVLFLLQCIGHRTVVLFRCRKLFMRKYLLYLIPVGVVVIFVFLLINNDVIKNKSESFFNPTNTTIKKPFTVLVVPGHDTDTGGASFSNIYERDLVVDVANNISLLLDQDSKYKVIVARNNQTWNPVFTDYFTKNRQVILDFKNDHQVAFQSLIASGEKKVILPGLGEHTTADLKTSIQLYGINKWADENDVDLIIHLHFNNSTRRNTKLPGKRYGFDIFIPEKQSANAATSRIVAMNIYNELQKKFNPEAPGSKYQSLFEDQSLIALGASNTLSKPSVLIEYGYIFEKILQTSESRKQSIEQMAEQTVAGIKGYTDSINY